VTDASARAAAAGRVLIASGLLMGLFGAVVLAGAVPDEWTGGRRVGLGGVLLGIGAIDAAFAVWFMTKGAR